MKRIELFLSAIVALLLISVPWIQLPDSKASSQSQECCCSQGSQQNCCCCSPTSQSDKQSDQSENDCQCTISTLPFIPDFPAEINNRIVDNQSENNYQLSNMPVDFNEESRQPSIFNNSPPEDKPPPSYILFGALLI